MNNKQEELRELAEAAKHFPETIIGRAWLQHIEQGIQHNLGILQNSNNPTRIAKAIGTIDALKKMQDFLIDLQNPVIIQGA